jgi:hypothetical protein
MIPVFGTLALLVTGRSVLALLPAGHTGSHALGALPLTAAVSWLLGLAVLTAQTAALGACGVRVDAWTLLAPWAIVLALQLALAPGALVPRHAPVRERASTFALGVGVVATFAAPLAIAFAQRGSLETTEHAAPALARLAAGLAGERAGEWLACARVVSAAALVCVCAHGLADVRANVRAVCLVVLAVLVVSLREWLAHGDVLHALLAGTAGVVFGLGWILRAERRSLALAVLAFALTPAFAGALVGPGLAGVAGLVALCVLTARPSRARAASWCTAGLAGAVLLAL